MNDRVYATSTTTSINVFNPLGFVQEGIDNAVQAKETTKTILDLIEKVFVWCAELPDNIGQYSIYLMGWLYELSATLILKTPLWIFNNEWFSNTTYMFSVLALGIVSILTILESTKQMLTGLKHKKLSRPMDFKTISKRWFLVAGATTAIPWLFQKAFQTLNFVSDFLIGMGSETMKAQGQVENVHAFDVLVILTFDIVLLCTIIPVLWQNGRRFFDLIVLGVISPLALTAWIFDPYRNLFNQWWSNLKHLSLVQVYYALFLLVLGWFIFGTSSPDTITGMIVKLLIVIGGYGRMCNPPKIVARHLDAGKGLDNSLSIGGTIKKVSSNYIETKTLLGKPIGLAKKAFTKPKPTTK